MSTGIEIDHDTAGRITVATLKDWQEYLLTEQKHFEEKTSWVHPEDYAQNFHYLQALELIINAFGG